MRTQARCAVAILALAVVATMGARAQTPAPVAHWTFSDGQGDVLHDVGGRTLNGRIVNAIWAKTAFGTGLRFDGQAAHVDCGAPRELALTGDLPVPANTAFSVRVEHDARTAFSVRVEHDARTATSDADGVLRIPLMAEGWTSVTIAPTAREAI